MEEEIESILYIAREISGSSQYFLILASAANYTIYFSVYKIPPLSAHEGHRANNWGDLACPLWKGRLRVIENSKGAALQLEDAQTGELNVCFASYR